MVPAWKSPQFSRGNNDHREVTKNARQFRKKGKTHSMNTKLTRRDVNGTVNTGLTWERPPAGTVNTHRDSDKPVWTEVRKQTRVDSEGARVT